MVKKVITEEQLRAANKAGYSTQQIAQELNKFEKRTGNDAVFAPTYKGPAEGTAANNAIAQQNTLTPAVQPVQTPVVQTPAPVETKTAEQAQYDILPESVTGIKPVIAPALQAKMDAKKNETPAVIPTETIAPVETTLTPEVVPTEVKAETVTTPTEVKTEVTDIEKNAQATGVAYTMENGQATYNPKTTEEAVKILAMGGKFQGESKMTAVAQAFLNKVRGLGQMTDQQLANNIAGGQVSNKELELLNTMNPQLVAQAKELSKKKVITNTTNEIQADNSAIIKGEEPTGMSKPLTDLLTKLADIDADTKSPAEMKTAYQDAHPEMIQSRDAINAITKQKRNATLAKINLYDEYKAKNSSLPISMIMAGYSALSRDLDNQIYLLNDDLNTEISNYNMYLDDMNAEIEFEIAQQGKQEQRLFDIYGVTSREQIRQEDIEREDARIEQSIQLEEARYERDIERDDMKSAEARLQKIEDMKMEMNMNIETGLMNLGVDPTGMTPEEMRANYARATQSVTNYERSLNQANLNLDYAKLQKSADAGDGTPAPQFEPVFNEDGTMKISDSSVYNLAIGPDGNSVQVKGVQEGGYAPNGRVECGAFVNDLIGVKIFGNKLSDKTKNINSTEPVVGGAFIEDVGKWGHVGFIESINEDGSINIIDSNYSKDTDGKIRRDTIAVGSPRWNQIKGFYDPSVETPGTTPLDKTQRSQLASAQKSAESRPEIKNWQQTSGVRKWIEGADKVDLNGSDIQGLISNYAKILDPDSVVREGEYAIAQSGASKGKADQIRQSIKTVLYGGSEVLSKDAQKVLVSAMKRRIQAMEEAYNEAVQAELGQAAAVMQIPVTEAQLLGFSNIKPSGNNFKTTKTDIKAEDDELNSLRGNTGTAQYSWNKGLTFQ